jgi:hypothetical protein
MYTLKRFINRNRIAQYIEKKRAKANEVPPVMMTKTIPVRKSPRGSHAPVNMAPLPYDEG